jgi:uncharacterized phage protein (TIGR02220 family)
MNDSVNYYAIIPANIRYDKNLKANCKLLYGEITALSNKEGYCWASNNYFSELYSVTPQAVSKWIKQLSDFGYISLEYIREGREIKQRKIRIEVSTNVTTVSTNDSEGYQQMIKGNNTYINNTINVVSSKPNDIDFDSLLVFFNKVTGKNLKVINSKAKSQFNARIKDGYSKQDISRAISNCFNDPYHKENPKYLTPEFISRPDKFEKYVDAVNVKANLPTDWFHRELTSEQKGMLTDEQLKQWNMNKRKLDVEGGRLKPIEK